MIETILVEAAHCGRLWEEDGGGCSCEKSQGAALELVGAKGRAVIARRAHEAIRNEREI